MPAHCHTCDHTLNVDSRFCPNCGTPVVAVPPATTPDNLALPIDGGTTAAPTAPEPTPVWEPAPVVSHPHEPPVGRPEPGPSMPPDGHRHAEPVAPSTPTGRSTGALVGVALGVVGLLAVGFLAVRFLLGGADTGGASSPEAVVEEMVAAINAQDPLAVVSLMAPDELDGVDTLVEDTAAYYRDLGLDTLVDEAGGSDDFELTIELDADRIDVQMEGDRAAIVSFELDGRVEVDGVDDAVFDDDTFEFTSRDLEGALPNGGDEIELIAVEIDGRWYASPMLTAGHYIVENTDLPAGDYRRIGADRAPGASSPLEAVDALVDVINDPDADDLAAALGGGEGRVAVAFRDAIDEGFSEIETGEVRYDLSIEGEDVGSGRVEFRSIDLSVRDDFSTASVSIEEDCITLREDGARTDRSCLLDALDFGGADDLDTTLFVDTVSEDGGRRVRIVPTVTDVIGRLLRVFGDRQDLLYAIESPQLDDANTVEPGSDIDIEFDGQLYAVNEFTIEEGEAYNVTATDDTVFEVFVDEGFGLERRFSEDFVAEGDGVARVVTYSEFDDRDEGCALTRCPPSGRGDATIRIRQGGRQTVPFPQRITGEFGPGDVRVFELEVAARQTVRIDVQGDFIGSEFVDGFQYRVDDDVYDLPAGTYELVVFNRSGDDDTSYDIVPSGG